MCIYHSISLNNHLFIWEIVWKCLELPVFLRVFRDNNIPHIHTEGICTACFLAI